MIWKSLLWIAFWFLLVFAVLALFGGAGNRRSARDLSDGSIEFAPGWTVFGAWLGIVVYAAYAAIASFEQSQGKPLNLVMAACLGLMAIVFLFSFPGTVVTTRDGLQQRYWFWRERHIRWEAIAEINTGKKSRTVTITGADGTKIVHSRQLADRPRFLLELKRHCGENLPQDFPREPIAGV